MKIAVLGAGSWGTTLAILLANNSHEVTLWSYRERYAEEIRTTGKNSAFLPGIRIPQTIKVTSDLVDTVRGSEMIVVAVPSQFVRGVIRSVSSLPNNPVVVNVAKGVENETLLTMSGLLHDVLHYLPTKNIVTLSGPSHAEEVSQKIPTTVVAASTELATAKLAQSVFMTPQFRVYVSTDLCGVELGGALKNVIAIAAGIVDGASLGDNKSCVDDTRYC